MKNTIITALVLLTVMLSVPLAVLDGEKLPSELPVQTGQDAIVTQDIDLKPKLSESFRIKITKSGEIESLEAQEYLFGVLAAEMPALYDEEALKAQTVAAYTYALRKKAAASGDYDLTDNPQTDQCYISANEAEEKWGEKAEEYTKKLKGVIDSVYGEVLTYNGALALTAYHSISSGATESCKDIWGSDVPYLVSVSSVGDKMAEGYLSTKQLSADEVKQKLEELNTASGEPQSWFSSPEKTKSGTVKTINYCGKALKGAEVAKALGLRSANFEVEYKETSFNFTVKGYGHGVGMSQNGAQYMAKQGSSYKEILQWYYKGCKLEKAKKKG